MTAGRAAPARVALVGAGYVASAHLEALMRCRLTRVVALCDPLLERARALADRHRVGRVYGSLTQLLAAGDIDAAHVLVPPDQHQAVAARLLEAGVHVLVEKPLALTAAGASELGARAARAQRALGVNHSMLFHPLLRRLAADLERGLIGSLQHLAVVHHVPLRQLESGDVSHFMFWSEANILLEQAVHPFSIVQRFLGRALEVTARVEPPRTLPTGAPFRDGWSIAVRCERGTAQVLLAFGRTMQESTVHAIATDGALRVDLHRSTYARVRKTRWPDFADSAANAIRGGIGLVGQGMGGAVGYALALFGLRAPADAFLQSMTASVSAFHAAARAGSPPPCGAADAAEVIEMCELTAHAAGVSWTRHPRFAAPVEPPPAREGEVVVTGATGFLGRAVVPALLAAGHPLTAVVRRPEFVGSHLRDPRVRVLVGDARDAAAMREALRGAAFAVHMATCAADADGRMEESMVAGARAVGEGCVAAGVRRLVFVSSTAALYLGGPESVTGAAPPDPQPSKRAPYARGKIAAEQELQRHVRTSALPLVVLRPAIVVGPGGTAAHGGVGLWVRDNHCVGWGRGAHPLPFVLARDCAQAIVQALATPAAVGRAYNLAGDVRLSAADYVAWLRRRTGRAYRFHPQATCVMFATEVAKWIVKVAARRPRELPSWRDLRSRSFAAPLDCADAKRDLGWEPEADRERFLAEVIAPAGAARGPIAQEQPVPVDAG